MPRNGRLGLGCQWVPTSAMGFELSFPSLGKELPGASGYSFCRSTEIDLTSPRAGIFQQEESWPHNGFAINTTKANLTPRAHGPWQTSIVSKLPPLPPNQPRRSSGRLSAPGDKLRSLHQEPEIEFDVLPRCGSPNAKWLAARDREPRTGAARERARSVTSPSARPCPRSGRLRSLSRVNHFPLVADAIHGDHHR